MKKSTRQLIAKDTLKKLKSGFYTNNSKQDVSLRKIQRYAESRTHLYQPEDFEELLKGLEFSKNHETKFEVVPDTTLDAVRNLHAEGVEDIFCLNFASAKNPGGGFLNGSSAQEESIARASGLYNCQLRAKPYYDFHRNTSTCLYSDHMIYSPLVPVFKLEDGTPMDEAVLASMVTSPAVNAGVVRRNEPKNVDNILPMMEQRIERMLAVAMTNGHENLILGAWGCGVFLNEPIEIARLFDEALRGKFKGQFKRIIFAVYAKDDRFITPFQERFQ